MAIKLLTSKDVDLSNLDKREVRPEGWYQWTVTGQELKEAKSTQAMGELTLKQLTEENNPDAQAGAPITFRVMFPDISDEAVFGEKLVNDGKCSEDEVETTIAERKRMASKGVRDVGVALVGYDDLPAVPRWSREDKTFLYADGTTATKKEKDEAYEARDQAAYDFAVKAFTGKEDLTRFVVFGNIKHREFNGQTQEEIGYLRCALPKGATLCGIK